MKRLYRLKQRNSILSDFYVFDTETGKDENGPGGEPGITWILNARPESFKLGVIYGRNYTRVIYSLEELKETFLEPRFKGKKVFAHNAFYDICTIFGGPYSLDPATIFAGTRFITATNGNCFFADSMNIFKTSVKVLGEMIGTAKPSLGNSEMWTPGITADVINRCVTDCQIVWDALFHIFEDVGNIKITQASLSLTYFRAKFMLFDIEHNDNTKYFFDSYFGGRTEAFKIGPTHASVIDVNSMYPDRMKNISFPNPKFLKVNSKRIRPEFFIRNILNNYEGCIYCTVVHKPFWIGYLPAKIKGKLVFPTGRFSGCWNFNELRFALDSGLVTIEKISKIVYAERMVTPFDKYVTELYDQRLKSNNDFEVYRIKIFMNSLYGKFAQRIDTETVYIQDIDKSVSLIQDYERRGLLVKLSLFNIKRKDAFLIVKSEMNISESFSIPSFASYITSAARVKLLEKLVAMRKNCPVYCDTDSIFFEIDTPDLVDSRALGGWKRENKIVTGVYGLKNYTYIDKGKAERHRIKGVPEKAKEVTPGYYEYANLMNTKEALRRNELPGVLTSRTKRISGKYDKRNVKANGDTVPLTI